ncbi:unnamed protein product, partial [Prorocentrum cordatum]
VSEVAAGEVAARARHVEASATLLAQQAGPTDVPQQVVMMAQPVVQTEVVLQVPPMAQHVELTEEAPQLAAQRMELPAMHVRVGGHDYTFASGDWNSNRLEIYVPPGTEYDEQSLFSTVSSGIAKALVFRNFTVYQRKKWMGADEACCDFALPLLLGNVLVEAYKVFCDRINGLPYRPAAHHPGGDAPAAAALGALLDAGALPDEEAMEARRDDAVIDPRGLAPIAVAAAEVARKRKVALDWLMCRTRNSPCSQVVVLKMILSILQTMQAEELYIGSKKWGRRQEAQAARLAGQPNTGKLLRTYAVLVHAEGEIEARAVKRMRTLLLEHRIWILLRDGDMTNDLKADAFTSLSSAGAYIEDLIAGPHSQPPWTLFPVLNHPELADAIQQTPKCQLDRWSRKFLERNDIRTDEAKMKLLVHAILISMNTDHLEVSNSHIRRIVKKHVQCQQADPIGLGTKWMAACIRAWSTAPRVSVDSGADTEGTDEHNPGGPKYGGGGAWRAFVRKQRSNDLAEAGRLYRALKDTVGSEVLEQCIAEGKAATERRRRGESAFGMKRSKVDRLQEQRYLVARMSEGNLESAVDKVISDAQTYSYDVAETMLLTNRLRNTRAAKRREEEEKDSMDIAAFEAAAAEARRGELASQMPEAASHVSGLRVVPGPIHGMRVMEADVGSACADATGLIQYVNDMQKHQKNFMSSLGNYWNFLHRTMRDDAADAGKSSDEEEEHRHGCCWGLGVCICSDAGAQLWRFRNSVLLAMKAMCPRSGCNRRTLLKDGHIVLRFESSLADGADDALADFWGLGTDVRYWHVSSQSLAPFVPRVQEMTVASDEEALGANRR